MKALSSAIVLGVGLLMVSGSPARAQFGEMGEAVKKGASDAAKQELMKQAGLPTPGSPAATPAAGVTTTPAGEAKVTPGAADTPAATAGAATTPGGEAEVTPGAAVTPAAAAGEDTGAGAATPPAGEPKVAPGAAATPAGLEGAAGTMMQEQMKKKIPKLP